MVLLWSARSAENQISVTSEIPGTRRAGPGMPAGPVPVLLRWVQSYSLISGKNAIDEKTAAASLDKLNVDPLGLDSEDKKYMGTIRDLFGGGPVGLDTISAALCEAANTIEEVIEPYLIQQGLIQKTPRGRVLTQKGFEHI